MKLKLSTLRVGLANYMQRFLIILTVLLILTGFGSVYLTNSGKHNPNSTVQDSKLTSSIIQDTTLVKEWVKKVITDYLNDDDLSVAFNNLKLALSDDYFNFKLDAINLEYSEMTLEEFHEKWEAKYEIKYVGNGGFFGQRQDSGKIEIQNCKLLKTLGDTSQIYQVVIRDLRWHNNYILDITIVKRIQGKGILIGDVKEYDQK